MPLKVVWRGGVAHLHGTVAGERVRRSAKTRDPDTAERIRAETEARLIKADLYGAESEATFADAAVLYFKAGGPRRYTEPLILKLGRRRLATIKPGDLKALALELYPDAKGNTRNRSVIIPARAIINHAAELGLCGHMRVKSFKSPKVQRQAVDRAWIDHVRTHAINPYVSAVLLFMFTTAARAGEAIALEPRHFDLAAKTAKSAKPTKNGSHRTFYLTDEMVEVLRGLPARAINFGRGPLRVFGYATTYGIRNALRRSCEAAGVPYHCPHEAGRHSFATEALIRQRLDPVTTAKLGNWDDVSVMMKHYAHAEHLPQVAEKAFGTSLTQPVGQKRNRRLKSVG